MRSNAKKETHKKVAKLGMAESAETWRSGWVVKMTESEGMGR